MVVSRGEAGARVPGGPDLDDLRGALVGTARSSSMVLREAGRIASLDGADGRLVRSGDGARVGGDAVSPRGPAKSLGRAPGQGGARTPGIRPGIQLRLHLPLGMAHK
ncbi:hypothetical protein [Paenibacillus oryzisoli]|uniref:hypothetical protein n=1 Tax=Paenibacillus oryzisoli TaxID=1850517 RepID=UPI001428D6E7|nr:hypothetical protein [Paenibacillus oryzisoli]